MNAPLPAEDSATAAVLSVARGVPAHQGPRLPAGGAVTTHAGPDTPTPTLTPWP